MQAFNLYHYSICTCVDKNKLQARNIYNAEINTWCQNIDPVRHHQNMVKWTQPKKILLFK